MFLFFEFDLEVENLGRHGGMRFRGRTAGPTATSLEIMLFGLVGELLKAGFFKTGGGGFGTGGEDVPWLSTSFDLIYV